VWTGLKRQLRFVLVTWYYGGCCRPATQRVVLTTLLIGSELLYTRENQVVLLDSKGDEPKVYDDAVCACNVLAPVLLYLFMTVALIEFAG